jgi:hypothetical protein
MTRSVPAVALAACLVGLGPVRGAETADRPLGKWERKIGKNQVTLVVEDNRLHVTVAGEKSCTLHADYTLTRDLIVYGVVTSVEVGGEEDAEKEMIDVPFSCRFRLDEGVLIVRDVKCSMGGDAKDSVWGGRFKPVAPPPSPTRAASKSTPGWPTSTVVPASAPAPLAPLPVTP